MATAYIDLARQGKNGWWRYLLGTLIIVTFWLGASVVSELILLALSLTGPVEVPDPLLSYLVLNFGHVGMLLGLFVAVRFLHKRPFLSLITPGQRFSWVRAGRGLGLWLTLSCVAALVDYVLHPSTYRFVLNPGRFILFAPVALILTPLQACAEELLFRGYLIQGAALWIRQETVQADLHPDSESPQRLLSWKIGVPALISGICFTLPHLWNPEVAAGSFPVVAYYFGIGSFLAFVTLKSNSLEFAMGIHTAACLFSALIVNYAHSVLETESIFFCTELAAEFTLTCFVIMAITAYPILMGWNGSVHKEPGAV
jgi:uncharacterized protein